MSLLEEIHDSQFDEKVLKSFLPVVLDCMSPECIICKTMDERLKEVARTSQGLANFFKINVNTNKVWQEFVVKVVPTLLYFKNGNLVSRGENFPDKEEIVRRLNELRLIKT
ncbi:MAG: thioredoxin family protein [Candidatus Omnitrophota bacterium]|nr:thioredoxin family protein [Candidatus Omnitrophota bacterium]